MIFEIWNYFAPKKGFKKIIVKKKTIFKSFLNFVQK